MTSEWHTVRLGDVATLQRGFDLPTRLRSRGSVPVVSSSGTSGWHNQAMVGAPGVVTGRYGTIGEVFFQKSAFWPLNTTLWVSNFHGNDPRYVYYLLHRVDFDSHSGKSGVPGVNRNDLHTELVALPVSRAEQGRIASMLADAEELVLKVQRLVAKKRAIKQGMMQELLTGRIRLQELTREWQRAVLGSVAIVDPESLSPTSVSPSTFIDYISLEDVSKGSVHGSTKYRFSEAPSRARRPIRRDDVLFGTVRPNLQSHSRYSGALANPVASTGFAVIRSRRRVTYPRFLAQWVLSDDVSVQVERIIAGSNYPAVSSGDVRKLEIELPTFEEQVAIGDALTDADSEIEYLERRLESARNIKEGMMQELLTGRTRLSAAGEIAA